MRVSEMVGQVAAWHLVTFPDAGVPVIAAKLLEEAFELQDAGSKVDVADELADVVLVAFALAGRAGINLERAIEEKFEINQERAHAGRWS